MDPVTLGVTGLGLLQQSKGNKSAAKKQGAAEAKQGAVLDRILKLFDTQMGEIDTAKAGGLFNADKQIALADEGLDASKNRARTTNASTSRIMGYRPGDSVPMDNDQAISEDFELKRRMQNFNIRQGAFANLQAARSGVNSGGLQSAGQMYGGIAKNYGDQQQNPGDLLGSFLKFYQADKK